MILKNDLPMFAHPLLSFVFGLADRRRQFFRGKGRHKGILN